MPAIIASQQIGLFKALTSESSSVGMSSLGQHGKGIAVNAVTGNLVLRQQDAFLTSQGVDAQLLRTYNSQGRFTDSFQFSWEQWLEGHYRDNTVVIHMGDGSKQRFKLSHEDENGRHYIATDGDAAHDTLTYIDSDRTWTKTDGSTREVYQFSRFNSHLAKLTQLTDKQGFATTLAYNHRGDLETITDASGQTLQFIYGEKHLSAEVQAIQTWSGDTLTSSIHYHHDQYKRLTEVIVDLSPEDGSIADGNVYSTRYEYYETNSFIGDRRVRPGDDLIARVEQSDGTELSLFYVWDSTNWRVKASVSGSGNEAQITRYDYHDALKRTDVIQVTAAGYDPSTDAELVTAEGMGLGATTSYIYDNEGRLYRVISPADSQGQRLVNSYRYDSDDNIIAFTDGRNQTTHYRYDQQGNQISQQDAAGNRVEQRFNENNQLISRTAFLVPDPDGLGPQQAQQAQTQYFVYDAFDRIRFSVDSNGQVIESRYVDGEQPRRQSVIRYSQAQFDLSHVSVSDELTLAQMEIWQANLSDLSGTTRIDSYLDFRGNIQYSLAYSEVDAVSGEGRGQVSLSMIDYDEKGNVLFERQWRNNFDWNDPAITQIVTRQTAPNDFDFTQYSYDGLGRMLFEKTVAAEGATAKTYTTEYQYDLGENGNQLQVTNAKGLVSLRTIDGSGQLISDIHYDQSVSADRLLGETRYFYDDRGRQIATRDGTGLYAFTLFDDLGREQALIDGSGAVIERRFNENDQVVEEIHYATRLEQSTLVSLITALNSLENNNDQELVFATLFSYNTLRPGISEYDRHTYSFYDHANRLSYFVDGEGTISKNNYDGRSELTSTIVFSDVSGVEAVRERLNPELRLLAPSLITDSASGEQVVVDTAQLIDGRYVSVWETDGSIKAQIFSATGEKLGAELLIRDGSDYGWDAAKTPVVTALNDGGFVVLWEGYDSYDDWDTWFPRLEWQQFSSTGEARRQRYYQSNFVDYVEGKLPSVTTLNDGSVVVTQQIRRNNDYTNREYGWDVHAIRLPWDEASGELGVISKDLTYSIVSFDAGDEVDVSIDALDNGGFAVTWQAENANGELSIKGKRFYKDGIEDEDHRLNFVDNDFSISSETNISAALSEPTLTQLKGGEFLALWQEANVMGGVKLMARRYSADRLASFAEYELNTSTLTSAQPSIAQFDDGSLIISWMDRDANGIEIVRVQHLDALGRIKNSALTLESAQDVNEALSDLRVTTLYGNRAVLTWSASSDGDNKTIYQRLLAIPKDPQQGLPSMVGDTTDPWTASGNRISQYLYDASGRLIATVDEEAFLIESVYDQSDRLLQTIAYANAVDSNHFELGLLTSTDLDTIRPESNDSDRVNRLYYNGRDELVGVLDAEGYFDGMEYDGAGNLLEQTRSENSLFRLNAGTTESIFTSDPKQQLERIRELLDDAVRTTNYVYNGFNELVSMTNWQGLLTEYRYDDGGNIHSKTQRSVDAPEESARKTTWNYDARSQMVSQANALANASASVDDFVAYHYDNAGRIVASSDHKGRFSYFAYNQQGQRVASLNANHELSFMTYNAFGELTSTRLVAQAIDSEDAQTFIAMSQQSSGAILSEAVRNLLRTYFSDNDTINTISYDKRGAQTSVIDGENYREYFEYNRFGEVSAKWQQISRAQDSYALTRFHYDERGLLVSSVNHVTEQYRDEPVSGAMIEQNYHYNAFANRVAFIDGQRTERTFHHDRLGRETANYVGLVFDGSTHYDAFGRVVAIQDARGHKTLTTYNDALTEYTITTPEGVTTQFSQNAFGETVRLKDSKGDETKFEYDANGNLIKETDAFGNTKHSTFDADNLVLETRDERNVKTVYDYDRQNRLLRQTIDPDGLSISTTYRYSAKGEEIAIIDGNNIETSFRYNNRGEIIEMVRDPSGLKLTTRYEKDGLGNDILVREGYGAIDATSGEESFTELTQKAFHFDALSRLLTQTQSSTLGIDNSIHYTYDNNGNVIREQAASGEVMTARYDAENRLVEQRFASGLISLFHYDANGNLIERLSGNHINDAQELVSLNHDGTVEAARRTRHVYDADNRHVYSIDALNHLTEKGYNNKGDLVMSIGYALKLDGLAEQRNLSIDQVKAAMRLAPNDDRMNLAFLDKLGRIAFEMDGGGFVLGHLYNAAGNRISTIRYPAAISLDSLLNELRNDPKFSSLEARELSKQLDAEAFAAVIQTVSAKVDVDRAAGDKIGDGTITAVNIYDQANRLVANVDGGNYLSLYRYDTLGNRTESQRFNVALTNEQKSAALALANSRLSMSLEAFQSALDALKPEASAEDRVNSITYDAANRRVLVTDHHGDIVKTEYDALSNLTAISHGLYRDENGNLRDDKARIETTVWDNAGRMVATNKLRSQTVSANGSVETTQSTVIYAYDDIGRQVKKTGADGQITLYFYEANSNNLTHTVQVIVDENGEALGEISSTRFNSFDEIIEQRTFESRIAIADLLQNQGIYFDSSTDELADTLTGGDNGALIALAQTGNKDNVLKFDIDRLGQVVSTEDGESLRRMTTYNAFGEVTQVIKTTAIADNPESVSLNHFDQRGLLVTTLQLEEKNGPAEVNYQYDAFGRQVGITDANRNQFTVVYDKLGRNVGSIDPYQQQVTRFYNAFDQLTIELDPLGRQTQYHYDLSTRTTTIQFEEDFSLSQSTNAFGEVIARIDNDGTVTRYEFDRQGNLIGMVEAEGTPDERHMHQEFDNSQRVISKFEKGVTTHYSYDAGNRVLSQTVDPEGRALTTTFRYDAKGNRIETIDPNGIRRSTEFDANNREIRTTTYGVERQFLETMTYNGFDKMQSLVRSERFTDASGATVEHVTKAEEFTYDVRGRRISEAVGGVIQRQYEYDQNDNVIKTVDANGNASHVIFDKNDRVRFEVNTQGGVVGYDYDAAGNNIRKVAYTNRINLTQWDANSIANLLDDAHPENQVSYKIFDKLNRQIAAIDARGFVTFHEYGDNDKVISKTRFATALTEAERSTLVLPSAGETYARFTRDLDDNSQTTSMIYDALKRVIYEIDAEDNLIKTKYAENDEKVSEVAFAEKAQAQTRASLDLQAIGENDRRDQYLYDGAGILSYRIDAAGHLSRFRRDAGDRIIGVDRFGLKLDPLTDYNFTAITNLVNERTVTNSAEYTQGEFFEYQDPNYQSIPTFDSRRVQSSTTQVSTSELTRWVYADNGSIVSQTVNPMPPAASSKPAVTIANASVLSPYQTNDTQVVLSPETADQADDGTVSEPTYEYAENTNTLALNLWSADIYERFRDFAPIKTLEAGAQSEDDGRIFALVVDSNGNVTEAETPLGQSITLSKESVDEEGNVLVDEDGNVVMETRTVWRAGKFWDGWINLSDSALTDGQNYQVYLYQGSAKLSLEELQAAASESNNRSVIHFEMPVGVVERQASYLRVPYESLPPNANRIKLASSDASFETQTLAIDDIDFADGSYYFNFPLGLDRSNDDKRYGYTIEFLGTNDKALRTVSGEFLSQLGISELYPSTNDSYTVSNPVETPRTAIYEVLESQLSEQQLNGLRDITVTVQPYLLDARGQILTENGEPQFGAATVVTTSVLEEIQFSGAYDGRIYLANELLADGQYHIRWEATFIDSNEPKQIGDIDLFAMGQQQQRFTQVNLSEVIALAGNSERVRAQVQRSTGEWQEVEVRWTGSHYQTLIGQAGDPSTQVFRFEKYDSQGQLTEQVTGELATNSTVQTLAYQQTESVRSSDIGSSLANQISAVEAANTSLLETRITPRSGASAGVTLAPVFTYIHPAELLDGSYEGTVNLSVGSLLSPGFYDIDIILHRLDGSQVKKQLENYEIEDSQRPPMDLIEVEIPSYLAHAGQELVAQIINSRGEEQARQLIKRGERYLLRTPVLVDGDYQVTITTRDKISGVALNMSQATLTVNDGATALTFVEAPLWQQHKHSEKRYDALGREVINVTRFDDSGRAFVERTRYFTQNGLRIEEKLQYHSPLEMLAEESLAALYARLSNLDIASRTRSYRDQNDRVVKEEREVLAERVELAQSPSHVPQTIDSATYQKTFHYDANGNLLSVVRETGATDYYTYDSLNRLTSQFLSAAVDKSEGNAFADLDFGINPGYLMQFEYDAFSNQTVSTRYLEKMEFSETLTSLLPSAQQPALVIQQAYNTLNQLVSSVETNVGIATQVLSERINQYNAFGNLVNVEMGSGNEVSITEQIFDGNNRLLQQTQAANTAYAYSQHFEYDNFGQLIAVRDAQGVIKANDYNGLGQLVQEVSGDGLRRVSSRYDSFGNIVESIDPKGYRTFYVYGSQNQLRFKVQENELGRPDNAIRGRVTEYRYNSLTHLSDTIRYANDFTLSTNMLINAVAIGEAVNANRSEADQHTHRVIDALGRTVVKVEDYRPDGNHYAVSTFAYDALGNRTRYTDSRGFSTTYAFEATGKEAAKNQAIASGVDYLSLSTYDSYEKITTSTVNQQLRTKQTRDGLGRVIESRSADGKVTKHRYDSRGNKTHDITLDANHAEQTTRHFYNALGQRVVTVDATGGVEMQHLDARGNKLIQYAYPESIQLNAAEAAQVRSAVLSGSSIGELAEILGLTHSPKVEHFTYDSLNRLIGTEIKNITTYTLDGGYQEKDNIENRIEYDAAGNNFKETNGKGNIQVQYFDEQGNVTLRIDFSGAATHYQFDNFGNVVSKRELAQTFSAQQVRAMQAHWNVSDLLSGVTSSQDRLVTYQYDNLNRLSKGITHGYRMGSNNTLVNLVAEYQYVEGVQPESTQGVDRGGKAATIVTKYALDANGRRVIEFAGTPYQRDKTVEYFQYDALNRKTEQWSVAFQGFGSYGTSKTNLTETRAQTAYQYDEFNNVTATMMIRNGSTIKGKFADYDGTLLKESWGLGGHVRYTYVNGYNTEITNLSSRSKAVMEYDASERVKSTTIYNTDSSGSIQGTYLTREEKQFNGRGQVTQVLKDGSIVTTNHFDDYGRLLSSDANKGVQTYYLYDRNGRTSAEIRMPKSIGEFNQVFTKSLSSAEKNQVRVLLMGHHENGNLNAVYLVNSNNMANLDQALKAQTSSSLLQRQQRFEFDAFGQAVAMVDARGGRWEYDYNVLGKVVQERTPEIALYDNAYKLKQETIRNNYYFGLLGQRVAVRDGRGNLTREISANGKLLAQLFSDGSTQVNRLDAVGDVRQEIIYSPSGNVLRDSRFEHSYQQMSDPSQKRADVKTVRTSWIQGAGHTRTVRHFDSMNNQTYEKKNSFSLTSTQVIDGMGRITQENGADGNRRSYSYYRASQINDIANNTIKNSVRGLVNSIKANGFRVPRESSLPMAEFHGHIKVTQWHARSGNAYKFSVDVYDQHMRVIARRDFGNHIVYNRYNESGALVKETGNTGKNIDYRYDYNNNLIAVVDNALNKVTQYAYDANRNLISESLRQNGGLKQSNTATFDSANQLVTLRFNSGQQVDYGYDRSGNRVKIKTQDNNGSHTGWYGFDGRNRQTIIRGNLTGNGINTGSGYDFKVGYDALSRRTSQRDKNGVNYTYFYETDGQLDYAKKNGSTVFTNDYDSRGRLRNSWVKKGDDEVRRKEISYNSYNQIRTEKDKDGNTTVYDYNSYGSMSKLTNTQDASGDWSKTTQRYYYEYWDAAKRNYVQMNGEAKKADNGDWKDARSDYSYDVNGDIVQIRDMKVGRNTHGSASTSNKGTNRLLTYTTDRSGKIIKTHENNYKENKTSTSYYYFFDNHKMGEKLKGKDNFDLTYEAIESTDAEYNYTVRAGQDLGQIAESAYGDASLWYVIAQANGISNKTDISQGMNLRIPTAMASTDSTNDTFKPYDATEHMAETTPTLPDAPPKPKSCVEIFVTILIVVAVVVVAVALTVATGGLASGAAAAASAAAISAGVSATAATAIGVTAGIVVGAAVGATIAVATNALQQGLMIGASKAFGLNLQTSFSWDQLARSAIVGGVGGAVGGAFQGFNAARTSISAVQNAAAGSVTTISQAVKVGREAVNAALQTAQAGRSALSSALSFAGQEAAKEGIGEIAGQLYDVSQGREFNWLEVGLATLQGAVSGAAGGSIAAKGRNTAFAVETAADIGLSYATEAVRAKVYNRSYDWVTASTNAIQAVGRNATARYGITGISSFFNRQSQVDTPQPDPLGGRWREVNEPTSSFGIFGNRLRQQDMPTADDTPAAGGITTRMLQEQMGKLRTVNELSLGSQAPNVMVNRNNYVQQTAFNNTTDYVDYVRSLRSTVSDLASGKKGRKLLANINEATSGLNAKKLNIRYGDDPAAMPLQQLSGAHINKTGSDVEVTFNAKGYRLDGDVKGNGYTHPAVVLGHELIHAQHMLKGRSKGLNLKEEFATVGLVSNPFSRRGITENDLRKELNKNRGINSVQRKAYSGRKPTLLERMGITSKRTGENKDRLGIVEKFSSKDSEKGYDELVVLAKKIDDMTNEAFTKVLTALKSGSKGDLAAVKAFVDDGYYTNWLMKQDAMTTGYVIESYITNKLKGVKGITAQYVDRNARPDFMIQAKNGLKGVVDITSTKESGHILDKDFDSNKYAYVGESLYKSIDFNDIKGTSFDLSPADLVMVQQARQARAERRLGSALSILRKHLQLHIDSGDKARSADATLAKNAVKQYMRKGPYDVADASIKNLNSNHGTTLPTVENILVGVYGRYGVDLSQYYYPAKS